MGRRQIVDDAVLWLSMLSIAVICLIMLYFGITGIAGLPGSEAGPETQAFALSVYVLYILLPLLIVNIVLDTTIISRIFEWSMPLLYLVIMLDIVLMTVLFLMMGL
ncbi:MAG: hypothetical protein A4E28_00907 [Methanocella sp. PtaU1.Bin125]|nr:MAG: hypothetical protein A4E28_00907 [Methanocella sp. PtaU1.Bin125]